MESQNNSPIPEETNADNIETQEARSFLREKFLRFIATLANKREIDVVMYENENMRCKLRAVDSNFENIVVDELKTPFSFVNSAIIRRNDIISIHVPNVSVEIL